ncbi:hypothetical protein F3Y22_tig00011079pilonHSYRG00192 [Hibiscus syriacus]|uniref:Peptidase M48 domain-containing protein n=1 Tax=Hibiscus syriacus TaxID=106335 RepID=A0A6A3C943_HIBSY|nr:uncharacterized protein LOC120204619 [Hibiscus syriacus]KAE8724018.1 hypothetical protein F3Y22_tig00011079pilonHSYRG00192 [Hibiscus syriacus]
MACCRRAKVLINSLRSNFTSSPFLRSPISVSSPIIAPSFGSSVSSANRAKFSGFSSYSSISQRLGISSKYHYNPFSNGAKRFYFVDRYQVHHFKPRGFRRWFQNPRNAFIVVLVGSGVLITVYFGNLETVPYTKRKHFVLLSKEMEKKLGEIQFEQLKAGFKGKILPAIHPESVRVRLIAKNIIDSLQRGLSHDQIWCDLEYASPESSLEHGATETLGGGEEDLGITWSREDEILDDQWVQQSRKESQQKWSSSKPTTNHLEGLNWEVLVINQPDVNAVCLPGGKIVVFTGLLEYFRTDSEIATIIGHEVAHAVARHIAETITKNLWFAILQLILYQFIMPDLVNTMSALFFRLPFSRRMELEADYIGLLLLASAGYDPRIAPKVFEKLGKVAKDSTLQDYLSTHPSGKKRAQLLAQAQVMEEALVIYRDVVAGRGVEGFL